MARPVTYLNWRGKQVEDNVNKAIEAAMNETMAACVDVAKGLAPVKTGALRDDISFMPAHQAAKRITGRWGNFNVEYSLYQELGTIFIAPKYYLKRASDQEYPKLPDRIEKHLARYS